MSSSRFFSSSFPNRKTALRMVLYGFIVLLMSNLEAMVESVIDPEIPYFDEEHLIVGGVTAIMTIILFGVLETHLARRRKMEAMLRESDRRSAEIAVYNQLVIDSSPLGIATFDAESGMCVSANGTIAKIVGATVEEILGQNFRQIESWKNSGMLETAEDTLSDGRERRQEVHIVTTFGKAVWLDYLFARFTNRDKTHLLLMIADITERKLAEAAVAESERKFRLIFDNANDGILLVDAESMKFAMGNRKICEMLGYSEEEILRLQVLDLHMEKDLPKVLSGFQDAKGGMRTATDIPMKRKDGTVFFADISSSTITDKGKLFLLGIFRDVTRERMLQQQFHAARKMEALGTMAGGIAHDFNNLLTVVLGHAEFALKDIPPKSPAHWSLTEITNAARRAADLSLQMLAYTGKSSFAIERVELSGLVEEMSRLLETTISKKAILNLHLERGLPPIQADPSQIRQIVMNLIVNASEAIGDRSGVVTVSVGATRCDEEYLRKTEVHDNLAPGPYVYLEVADTGCGMDAGTRSRIFEPFFSTKFTGRGLGLAAALGIVRAHKGTLKVDSEPGEGTTFKILFPAMEDAGEKARSNESSPLADWRGKGTILLVDDEESLLALGARMLEHLGFTVLTAADGLQAVELYRQRGKEIDLVLMDLTMPHMDGAEAFGELRRLNPDVRVILASGYGKEDVASRFAGNGIDGVLQKPYTLARLRESLAGLMPKRLDG